MRILMACLATAALAATSLVAQGRMGPRDGSRTPNFDAVKAALNISDAQLAAIQQNNEASRDRVKAVFEETAAKREQMQAELESANPNPTTIGQLMLDARANHEKIAAIRAEVREQNLAGLDEQQKAALQALVDAEKRDPALREAAMLNLIEGKGGPGPGMGPGMGPGGPGGGPGMGGRPHGPRGGGFGGGPRS